MDVPRMSIILTTVRDDFSLVDLPHVHIFQPTVESLQKQTFKDFELIVVDGLQRERDGYFQDVGFAVRHVLPKPSPYAKRGQWAVCNSFNTGLLHARGELVVRLDDACQFDAKYLERLWCWHTLGYFPLSLTLYHKGGRIARYDGAARNHFMEQAAARGETPDDIARKIEHTDALYRKHQAIEDTRLSAMTGDIQIAPWNWVYGYVALPLKILLAVNGYDEAFDGKKSLEDVDLALRVSSLGYPNKFVLDKGLRVVENFHRDASSRVMWDTERPAACNYAILKLHERQRTVEANRRRFTPEELRQIAEETRQAPCSHCGGSDYALDEGFSWWADRVPTFDLVEMRRQTIEV